MSFGRFALDRARRQLLRGETPIHLIPKAFELLALLIAEAPRVVENVSCTNGLWPGTFVPRRR